MALLTLKLRLETTSAGWSMYWIWLTTYSFIVSKASLLSYFHTSTFYIHHLVIPLDISLGVFHLSTIKPLQPKLFKLQLVSRLALFHPWLTSPDLQLETVFAGRLFQSECCIWPGTCSVTLHLFVYISDCDLSSIISILISMVLFHLYFLTLFTSCFSFLTDKRLSHVSFYAAEFFPRHLYIFPTFYISINLWFPWMYH